MCTLTLKQFVRTHRAEIERIISPIMKGGKLTEKELIDWVRNDEGLLCWAREEGVRI